MSPSNFGERYFSIRDQLASLMAGVTSLADDAGVDVSDALPSAVEVAGGLRRPFVLAVCGEVNAGKSMLFNALFGQPVCRTGVVPVTLEMTSHVHGARMRERNPELGVVERSLPLDFLHDFHLIDTPGTNTPDDFQRTLMRERLPEAELMMCVFPVDNPWGATVWNFLSDLSPAVIDKVVFVIQQADLREAKDLEVIRGHMRDLSMKRLGRLPPVFAVSAVRAYEAKRQTPADLAGWRESGMPELEEHIARAVCQSPQRMALLAEWRERAGRALWMIEDRMEEQVRGLHRHAGFLEEVEGEIDAMRERFVKRLPHHLQEVADVFGREADEVTRVLSRRLGLMPSVWRLFTRGRVGAGIERLFVERLESAVERVARSDADEVAGQCGGHWRALGPRVEEALGIRMEGQREMEEAMERARATFVKRLGRAAAEGVGRLNVRRQLDADLRLRNVSLTSFTAATLGFTTTGAVCGALGLRWLPWIFCGLAAMFFAGGVIAAVVTRRRITRDHRRALDEACGRFADTLRGDTEDALRMIFGEYAQCLGAVREHLVRERRAIEPRQRRWQEMFLHLKALEQEW